MAGAAAMAGAAGQASQLIVLAATEFEMSPLAAALGLKLPAAGAAAGPWPTRVHGDIAGRPLILVVTGLGKVNAAAALTAAYLGSRSVSAVSAGTDSEGPTTSATDTTGTATVLQFGVAGVYPGGDLPLEAVALARSERDLDLGVGEDRARAGLEEIGFPLLPGRSIYNRIELGGPRAVAISSALGVPLLDFATSDGVTASDAGAAATAARFGVAVESMEGFAAAQVAAAFGLDFIELRAVSNRVGERDKAGWRLTRASEAAAAAAHSALRLL